MGFDPSAPDLTLGHAVGLRKLRQLQDLGHTIVVIVGDWTARIGDPSGQSKTRPMLTAEQVKANAETYLRQFSKIVDRELTEIRWQSEWFDEFTLADVVSLAAKFTVAQMLERGDFAERFEGQKPIGIHELFYPLLQAYDSVAVQADVEFGGTDQTFNLHGRARASAGVRAEAAAVFTVPLLVGTDGVKMSKSQGNYVALEDPPHEMYGKLMSITDPLVGDYFELLTDVPDDEVAAIRDSVEKRAANPMEAKKRLAREITAQFHDEALCPRSRRRLHPHLQQARDPRRCPRARHLVPRRPLRGRRGEPPGAPDRTRPRPQQIRGHTPHPRPRRRNRRRGRGDFTHGSARRHAIRVGKHRFLRLADADADHP